jgi:hypothetical protein
MADPWIKNRTARKSKMIKLSGCVSVIGVFPLSKE